MSELEKLRLEAFELVQHMTDQQCAAVLIGWKYMKQNPDVTPAEAMKHAIAEIEGMGVRADV